MFRFADTPDNETLRKVGHDLLPATLGQTMGALWSDPTLRPTGLALTEIEIRRESGELRRSFDQNYGPALLDTQRRQPPLQLSEMLAPDVLNEKYGHLGLSFKEPTRSRVAEILAEQKLEEKIRDDVIARGPRGFVPTIAGLGVSLLSSAIDPINLASAFVPVVGEARYAAMVARTGKTVARLAKGTAEGFVGGILVEPGTAIMSKRQQLDYTMGDAILNVTLGTVLGGTLRVVGGKVGDRLRAQTPEIKEASFRGAVAQMIDGRSVDVSPFAAFRDTMLSGTSLRTPRAGGALPVDVPALAAGTPGAKPVEFPLRSAAPEDAPVTTAPERIAVPLTQKDGSLRVYPTEREAERAAKSLRGELVVEPMGDGFLLKRQSEFVIDRGPGGEVRTFKTERAARKHARDVLKADDAEAVRAPKEAGGGYMVVRGATPRDLAGMRAAPDATTIPAVSRETFTPAAPERPIDVRDFIRREGLPARDATADFEASREIREALERTDLDEPVAQADMIADEIEALRSGGLLSKEDEAIVASARETLEHANALQRGIRAAAFCLSGK
jgi:hypothetical protein